MAAKLVRGGERSGEHVLGSFNVLGSGSDSTLVVPEAAEEHVSVTLGADGWYRLRALDGEVEVNGAPAVEHVLRTGDVIHLRGAHLRFVMDVEPARPPDPPRGSFAPRALDPCWTVTPTQGRVVALVQGAAVVRAAGSGRSRVLIRDGAQWHACDEVQDELSGVWSLSDGTWVGLGEGSTLFGRAGDLRIASRARLPVFEQVCGPSAHSVYGLSKAGLHHFDGDRWRAVSLADQGVGTDRGQGPVLWTGATCDATGRCWIVGADHKHGVLATGVGETWEVVGASGIGALSHVARGGDETLFVVGCGMTRGLWPVGRASHRVDPATARGSLLVLRGDRRWSRYGGAWSSLDEALLKHVWPVAFGCCELDGTRPILVGVSIAGPTSELCVLLGGDAYATPTPGGGGSKLPLAVSSDGRLIAAVEGEIWTSRPLIG